ncbi:type II toxin-antitoxin system VapC family toxin [Spirosoma arcticum]
MAEFYLADTQVAIWSVVSPSKIKPSVQLILQENSIVVSEISLIEIAVKQKIGRLPGLSLSVDELATQLLTDGFYLLPVDRKHIAAYEQIPLFDDHRDPFDRLLLATALVEKVAVISSDEKFRLYVPIIRLIDA